MANVVKLKRGTGSDPTASDMVVGEPVIRTDTAELFFKKDDGSVAKVSGGGGGPDFKYLELRNAANNGAASYPGNDFTLVTAGTTNAKTPTAANTLLVSYGGVIQKPNSGTSTSGITGFIVDGSRLKTATNFAAAPDFILYQESGGIGEPSDDTVTTDKIVDDAVTADKLANSINSEIAANTAKVTNATHSGEVTGATALTIADNVVDEANLKVSNSPTNGYFLSAQSGNTGGLTWADVPAGVGGATGVDFNDDVKARWGTGNDLEIFHEAGAHSWIKAPDGRLNIQADDFMLISDDSSGRAIYLNNSGGHLELGFDGNHDAYFNGGSITFFSDLTLNAQKDLRFADSDSSNYVAFQAPATISSNVTWTLPAADGSANQYLQTAGNGTLSWATVDLTNLNGSNITSGTVAAARVATLNQNTTGSAATLTTARTIGGTSFDGSANIDISYSNLTNKPTIPTNNNQLTNGAGYVTSAGIPASGGTFTGDVTFDGGASAIHISGGSDIRLNSGNWTGEHCKIQHHSNWLYIQGGSSGHVFRASGGTDRWYIDSSGHFRPSSNASYNIGNSSNRVANLYVNDMHFSNKGKKNVVDGTWGDWTLQEGEETIYMINNRSGKRYKMGLQEVT
tara:strand:- start:4102 stop:5976 length:1875 start_codon:yes stop_codon:yes gene_type:complete